MVEDVTTKNRYFM
jgi:hypothetical protein